ncbi:MAG TPA: hypothetical protein ENH94_04485 [Phycisphaerales bacterium]|nr:hypothetical protein [Phycisphaerales bacterium]
MGNLTKHYGLAHILAITIAMVSLFVFTPCLQAYPKGSPHAFVGGPWEIAVSVGSPVQEFIFPVKVPDENKSSKLEKRLPIMGTPVKIRFDRYVPALSWETIVTEKPGSGAVASIVFKGPNLHQQMWLDTNESKKQSVTSSIGGIALKKIQNSYTIEKLSAALTSGSTPGVLLVWKEDAKKPLEYIVDTSKTIAIPGTNFKIKAAEYIPHYSIDTTSKEVTSASDKPLNPALKVSVSNDEKTVEQWLWSKFPTSPHVKYELPLRIEFQDFDLNDMDGSHIIAVAKGQPPYLFSSIDGKVQAQKIKSEDTYFLADKEYSFIVEKTYANAVTERKWKNIAQKLSNPAIIATIEYSGQESQAVLEFNKPFHFSSGNNAMIVVYRRKAEAPIAEKQK